MSLSWRVKADTDAQTRLAEKPLLALMVAVAARVLELPRTSARRLQPDPDSMQI